jgi:hypothetical protein
MMKLVKNEPPHAFEVLNDVLLLSKEKRISGLCLVYIVDDKVYTDYVKSDGTSILELVGCVEIMRAELIEGIRG